MVSREDLPSPTGKGPIRIASVTPLNGSQPHALLYDLTHDNETPLDKRSAEDALSTGALTAFSYCAVGSVKGFDDLYPKLLNLVRDERHYEITGYSSGIAKIKKVLNNLHLEMVLNGFEEGHVHQENDVSEKHFISLSFIIHQCHSTLCSIEWNRHRKKGICLLHIPPFRKAQRTAETVRSLNQNPTVR